MFEKNGMPQPLVSVIIRSMDRPTLGEALNSVAAQTYPNIEVVIVNAKGKSHRILDSQCGRFPVQMTGNHESMSRSQAANIGLHAAQGNYLIFLDDDDWFLPHHIENLQLALARYDSAIAAYAGIQCVDESGAEISRYAERFDPIQLRIENFIPIHAALFRRQALDNGAHFDAALDLCEDWDFWLQLLEQGEFKFVDEIGAIYRIQKGMGSGIRENRTRTRQVMIAIYKKWIARWNDDTLWAILEYARYKKTAGAKEQELLLLKQIIADRDQQISDLMNSTSWRITQPMRTISTLLKKIWPNSK
ncbi:MAG: glycosyltransferase [Betaproteobacteria bacterium]|nr:glycosyltransferase [Betaproteobacteria bacterium]